MGRITYVLHSDLTPESVAEVLRHSIDEERRAIFSLSGYQGDRPLLGEVGGGTFRVQRRRYYRNDFAPHFYARFGSEEGGTRIEGYFDARVWVKYFMRIWLCFAILIGAPIFIASSIGVATGRQHVTDDTWVGLVVPPALMLFGVFLPKLGSLLGRADRQFMLEQLQRDLHALILN